MPATPLLHKKTQVVANPGNVVATHSDEASVTWIRHVGLLRRATTVEYGRRVRVAHMRPPFEDGMRDEHTMASHAIAWQLPERAEMQAQLEYWLADVRTRMPSDSTSPGPSLAHYTVDPPFKTIRDDITRIVTLRQFSCAGFVWCFYKEMLDVELVDLRNLPPVTTEMLQAVYDAQTVRVMLRYGVTLGVPGAGPWSLLLPGYILNAFAEGAPLQVAPEHALFAQ